MWELIEANRRKSLIIFLAMGILFLTLGYLIGQAFFMSSAKSWTGSHPHNGGRIGLAISGLIWLGWSLTSYFFGDSILLAVDNASVADKASHAKLYNIVEEMSIAANFSTVPQVYIIYSSVPNAFATGRGPEKSAIAVTSGLLTTLNRDELQGVIAHEMSHIINRDVLLLTFAGVMVGSVQLISELFLRNFRFVNINADSDFSSDSGSQPSGSRAVILACSLVFALLAPIITTAMYFTISRTREYLADASAIRLTRYPQGLADALEKIGTSTKGSLSASKLTAAMYIRNPLYDESGSSRWMDTHPPLTNRIKILRSIAGSAGTAEYQKAFRRINGGEVFPPAGNSNSDTDMIPIRESSPDMQPLYRKDTPSAANGSNLSARQNFPVFLTNSDVPQADISTGRKPTQPVKTADGPGQQFVRVFKSWDMVPCIACGETKEITPDFSAPYFVCRKCGRKIYVKNAPET